MKYLTKELAKKHELEKQGYPCEGMHTVRVNGVPTGEYEWEFTIPDIPAVPVDNTSATVVEQVKETTMTAPAPRRGRRKRGEKQ